MLEKLKIIEFMEKLSSKDVPVGGGSASALNGLLAVGLLKMAVEHSLANPSSGMDRELLQGKLSRLDHLSNELAGLINRDAEALGELFEIFSAQTPESTDETAPACQKKLADSLETAAKVPLQTAAACLETMEIALKIATIVGDNLKSELMSAVICGHAGATGALMSTAVNLSHLENKNLAASLAAEIQTVNSKGAELKNEIEKLIFREYPFDVFLA